jgi:hypothetical protein
MGLSVAFADNGDHGDFTQIDADLKLGRKFTQIKARSFHLRASAQICGQLVLLLWLKI